METRISVRVPDELHQTVRLAAVKSRKSLQAWVIEAVQEKLKREQKKKP